jgi:ribulose-phosphate 3-epimerase
VKISPVDLRLQGPVLSAGILTADILRLGEELRALESAQVEIVHIDVMDGVFCPPLTVGPPIVKAIPDRFVKDVHLMIDEPLGKVDVFVEAGADILSFHLEATRHPHRVLRTLAGSVVRGIALNPGTPVAALEPLLDELELVLVLAVDPGWPGQSFSPATAERVAQARELIGDRPIAVAVDGGITRENAGRVASLSPDLVVAGSAVFDGGDPVENARTLVAALRAGAGRDAHEVDVAR